MKTQLLYLSLLFVLFATSAVSAQTIKQQAEEDFTRISKKYQKYDKYKMDMVYALYADSAPDAPVTELKGVAIVNGSRKYQKVGEMESYYNERYSLVFNHALKTLSFMPSAAKATAITDGGFQGLSQFITSCDSISYSDKKEERVYTFSGLTGNYNKIEVSFNKKTFAVNSVKLISAHQGSSLLVTYADMSTKAIPGEEWFSYTNFLTYENQAFKCKTPFESYELFNQISNPEIIK